MTVTGLKRTPGDGTILLTWTPVTTGNAIIVKWRAAATPTVPAVPWPQAEAVELPVSTSSYTITGLSDGVSYDEQVNAVQFLGAESGTDTPLPPPPPPPPAIWAGDFSDQTTTAPIMNPKLPQWGQQQGAFNTNLNSYPYAVQTLYPMSQLPAGIPAHPNHKYALRMVSNDSDAVNTKVVAPYDGVHAGYPATGVISKAIFGGNGGLTSAFIGFSILFDPSFPAQPGNDFFQFMELFGVPFTSPALYLGVEGPGNGIPKAPVQSLYLDTGAAGNYPWTMPLTRGEWIDFVLGLELSTDPTLGSLQLWVNGQPQTFNGSAPAGQSGLGTETWHSAVLRDATNRQMLFLDNYRTKGWCQSAAVWVCGAKVGSSYASVAP